MKGSSDDSEEEKSDIEEEKRNKRTFVENDSDSYVIPKSEAKYNRIFYKINVENNIMNK